MKTFKFFPIICAASMMAAACQSDKTDTPETDGPEISIKLTSEAPVNARPGEEVSYTFSVAYGKGLAEAVASLDKQEIAGSKATFNNSPVEDTYSFSYTPDATQTGKTLDFVVTVTGTDGALKTSDVPLYVLAAEADIKIIVPDDAPESHEIGTDLAFTVRVTSGTDIRSIKTLKNSTELPELTMETFTDRKNVDYAFTYSPTEADVIAPVTFTFQAMDTNGNIVSENYSVSFTKPAAAELNEFYNITMGYQTTASAGPYLSSTTGQVFMIPEGYENSALIDIVIYWSANSTTQGLGVTSPSSTNAQSLYGGSKLITDNGGDENDIITNWETTNTVKFKLLSGKIKGEEVSGITLEEFSGLSKAKELEDLYNNSASIENVTALMVQPGCIFAFRTAAGKYGVLRIASRDANKAGNVVVDLKSAK